MITYGLYGIFINLVKQLTFTVYTCFFLAFPFIKHFTNVVFILIVFHYENNYE